MRRALVAMLLFAPAASPGDELERTRANLERGWWGGMDTLLITPDVLELLANPEETRHLCRRAADLAYSFGFGKDGEEALKTFEDLSERLLASRKDSADAIAARGEAWLMRARSRRAWFAEGNQLGPKDEQSPGEFAKAAEHFTSAYENEAQDGGALARLVQSLIEQAWAQPGKREALLAAADGWVQKLETSHADTPHAPLTRAALLLEGARDLVGGAKTKPELEAVREMVRGAFAKLAPFAEIVGADTEIPTLHNEIVTFTRTHPAKLRIGAAYITDPWQRGCLSLDRPRSRFVAEKWVYGDQIFAALLQWRADGRAFRLMNMNRYRWKTNYTYGPRAVAGDNPKGLSQELFEEHFENMPRRQRVKPVTKGRLNRHIPSGYVYEVIGTNEFGQAKGNRAYVFKAKESPISLEIVMTEIGTEAQLDPMAAAIIESMREVK